MRKIILTLLLALFSMNVYAEECTKLQIEEGQTLLSNITYNIEYADNYMDMGGNFQEGYMRFKFKNLPSGYYATIKTTEGDFVLDNNERFAHISGGVHNVSFYSTVCDSIIKTFDFRVPHYKQYCGVNVKCEENAWFDGTYENSSINQNKKPKSKLSIKLIVILVMLVAIIVLFVVVTIKRRKLREKGF